jgi:thioredoxin-like negative regulator of GroEL
MSKPTREELELALSTARMMREQSDDPCYMAKALLNCHYQSSFLREVMQAAQEYLRSGQSEAAHTRLLRVVEKARQAEDRDTHVEHPSLGL